MNRRMSIASFSSIAAVMVAALSACTHASVVVPASSAAKASSLARAETQPRVPGEYLVRLALGVDEAVIFERYSHFGIKQVSALGDETFLLILSNDPGPQQMEALILDEERIEAIQPNIVYWANRSGSTIK